MDIRTERLRDLMRERRLTPLVVATLLGVSPRTVSNWKCLGSADVIPQHRLDMLELRLQSLPFRENP